VIKRIVLTVLGGASILFFGLNDCFAEDITITTYYPSPNGIYDQLLAGKMAVGDMNGDGSLNASDIPTTSGNLFVKGTIAVNRTTPLSGADWNLIKLDLNGFGLAADSSAAVLFGPAAGHAAIELREIDNSGTPYIDFSNDNSVDYDARIILLDNNELNIQGANLVIGDANTTPALELYVNGRIGCSNPQASATKHVFDVAEIMPVEGEVSPGDVVVLVAGKDRVLSRGKAPYDCLVTGIVSSEGNSAKSTAIFLIGNKQDALRKTGRQHEFVAIVGQVAVNVCLENGPIEPGDLLVTSSVPGYAMKGTDQQKMFGAVVGKAMERFAPQDPAQDKGQIIALLSLQ
jgi:hypothetical protein